MDVSVEDGDLSLKHVEFMFMDNLYFYRICVHMLVYIDDNMFKVS